MVKREDGQAPQEPRIVRPRLLQSKPVNLGPIEGYKKWSWTRPAHVLAAAAQGTFMRAWGPAALVRPQNMGVMPQKATQKAPPCALCTPDTLMYCTVVCGHASTVHTQGTVGCSFFTAGFPSLLPRPMASRKDRTKGLP